MPFDKFYKKITDWPYDKMVDDIISGIYEVTFLYNEKVYQIGIHWKIKDYRYVSNLTNHISLYEEHKNSLFTHEILIDGKNLSDIWDDVIIL
jgi:hypothetical protein